MNTTIKTQAGGKHADPFAVTYLDIPAEQRRRVHVGFSRDGVHLALSAEAAAELAVILKRRAASFSYQVDRTRWATVADQVATARFRHLRFGEQVRTHA